MSITNDNSATDQFLSMDQKQDVNHTEEEDIETLAISYLTYRVGEYIYMLNKFINVLKIEECVKQ